MEGHFERAEFNHLRGLGPKLLKIGFEQVDFDHLGGLVPKLLKMHPKTMDFDNLGGRGRNGLKWIPNKWILNGPMGPFGVIPKPFRMVSYSEASPNGKAVPNGLLFRMEGYALCSNSRENAEPNVGGSGWILTDSN